MNENNDVGIKPQKNIHSEARTLFLKTAIRLFAPLFILFAFILGPVKGIFFSAAVSLAGTLLVLSVSDKIGNVSKLLYGGGEADISLREQMQGKLKAVRVAKMNEEFKTALDMVNEILQKDPDFYEAMFVKAQILDQGFQKPLTAKKYAQKVMNNTPKGQTLHNWASSFYDELSQKADSA